MAEKCLPKTAEANSGKINAFNIRKRLITM